jgi:hypothetical protein
MAVTEPVDDVFHDEEQLHNGVDDEVVHPHVFHTQDGFSIGDVSNITDDASSVSSRLSISSKNVSSVFKQVSSIYTHQIKMCRNTPHVVSRNCKHTHTHTHTCIISRRCLQ